MFILLLLLLLLVGAQCPERAGGSGPRVGFSTFSSVPSRSPEPPSPSFPPPPLPSPALPLVPGSLRRTHHDGRRRTAPDSVSTRDRGCQAPSGPGTRDAEGGNRRPGPEAESPASRWSATKCIPHLSLFPREGSPPFPPEHSYFLGCRARLDLFLPIPSLHTLPRPVLCTAEAVRLGRAPAPPMLWGFRAEPGAVGLHRGRAWRGWDRCCILWPEYSASVHVLSGPRPQPPGSFPEPTTL